MRRGIDGRVQLKDSNGNWYQLKLDNEVKGTMLLRELKSGSVFVLQTDKLEQVRKDRVVQHLQQDCIAPSTASQPRALQRSCQVPLPLLSRRHRQA